MSEIEEAPIKKLQKKFNLMMLSQSSENSNPRKKKNYYDDTSESEEDTFTMIKTPLIDISLARNKKQLNPKLLGQSGTKSDTKQLNRTDQSAGQSEATAINSKFSRYEYTNIPGTRYSYI